MEQKEDLTTLVRQLVEQNQEIVQRLDLVQNALTKTKPEWFSVEDAAALAGLSTKHIRRAIKRGELVCSNVGGERRATYRIARKDIETWMESKRLKQGPSKSARQALVDEFFPGLRKRRTA